MKSCGSCTLCCELVPVEEIGLPAFTRCPKLHSLPEMKVGCSIYSTRPRSCKAWNCQWLVEEDWPDDLRPDRCGVVVDILPDLIRVNGIELAAWQMWAAPGFEMAFQHQPVLSVVMALADQKIAVIWRWKGADGKQTGRVLMADPKTGELGYSAETPPDQYFSQKVPTGERMRRAMRLSQDRFR